MFRFVTLFVVTLIIVSAGVATAQENKTPTYPPYIQSLADQGAQVRYLGKKLGLNAWLTARGGRVQYVYVTPNQEANIVGMLLDRNGQLVTEDQLDAFAKDNPESFKNILASAIPGVKQKIETKKDFTKLEVKNPPKILKYKKTPSSSPAEVLYTEIEQTNWFEIGDTNAPLIYAVIDPDCTHCHRLIQTLREGGAYKKGQIRTRLVPVGIMSGEALYRAGTLLSLPNKEDILFAHIDGDESALPVDKEATLSAVSKNMAFLQKWNLDVTPFLIYRSRDGSLKIVRGVPKDMDTFLKDIAKNS